MKNQESEDAAEAASKTAAAAAMLRRRTAMPVACVAEAKAPTRTFLIETLEGFGFAACECAQLAALGTALDARPPDLVVIGSPAGGIEACEMMEMLATKDYEGKVLVLGPRASPMVAAVRALGGKLGLAMLPLLPMPFSAENLRDSVASLLHAKTAPPAIQRTEVFNAHRPELRYQAKRDARTLALSGAAARVAASDWSEGIEDQSDPGSAARSARVLARLIEDWRDFLAPHGAIEIAIELPIAFFRDPEAIAALCRQLPDHPSFAGTHHRDQRRGGRSRTGAGESPRQAASLSQYRHLDQGRGRRMAAALEASRLSIRGAEARSPSRRRLRARSC